jgi:hypothetical protein|tara:strand:+ start:2209 stop:2481 length:273 start_codon:yes stop_codon:yes gene_type:complete
MQALKRLLAVGVAVELVSLAGTYVAFHTINTDPEFRGWVDSNCPPEVLDGFCVAVQAVGYELPADLKQRQVKRAPGELIKDSSSGSKRAD